MMNSFLSAISTLFFIYLLGINEMPPRFWVISFFLCWIALNTSDIYEKLEKLTILMTHLTIKGLHK